MLHLVDSESHEFVEVQIIDDVRDGSRVSREDPDGGERFQLIQSRPSPGVEPGINATLTPSVDFVD